MSGSSICEDFTRYSTILSQCYDKHEKIYKLSRDLTRESKKIICTLHRLPGSSAEEQSCVMTEAEMLLAKLRDGIISDIASLLLDEPLHFFMQAYCSGMEEYIEALQFYNFLLRGSVLNYSETWRYLLFSPGIREHCLRDTAGSQECNPTRWDTDRVQRCQSCTRGEGGAIDSRAITPDGIAKPPSTAACSPNPACTCGSAGQASTRLSSDIRTPDTSRPQPPGDGTPSPHQSWVQLLPHDVFILGLSDVSGELMRYCIKSVAVGELEQKDRVVNCLRQMKAGYVALGLRTSKYLSNKIHVHERNLSKVESVNYDLRLRGSELTPAQLRDDLLRRPLPDEDDGPALVSQ